MLRELFRTPTKTKPVPTPQPKPAPVGPPPRSDTVLGVSSQCKGNLKTDGNLRIDGTFTGDIVAGGKVQIGEQAHLEGNMIGETVDVAGVVRGDIVARKVSVSRTGRVWGNLRLEKLMTDEGAFIQGLVTMEEHVEIPRAHPAKEEVSEKPAESKPVAEAQKVKVQR